MSVRDDIMRVARSKLGYAERRGNINIFGAFFGMDRQPWCAFFVAWVYLQCGIDLRKYCDNVGYTPNLFGDLKALGWAIDKGKMTVGCIVFFQFIRERINHVGLCRDLPSKGQVYTIDGNTGGGSAAAEYNGGGVAEKTRPISKVAGVIQMPQLGSAAHVAADNTLQTIAAAIFLAKLTTIGFKDSPNNPDAIRILQSGVNRWFDQLAAMANKPNPPDIAVDGVWGQQTWDAVAQIQRITGVNDSGAPDGKVGIKTWNIIYK